jgi:List-Bact-rpt repeat protein
MINRRTLLWGLGCAVTVPLLASCGGSSNGNNGGEGGTDGLSTVDVTTQEGGTDGKTNTDAPSDLVTLTVTVPMGEGSVLSQDHQIYCGFGGSCTGKYPLGTVVTLSEAKSIEYLFKGWGGACAMAGTDPQCIVTLEGATSVSVSYEIPPDVTLTVMVTGGTGDMVTSNPMGISTGGSQTANFQLGTEITLTAVPASEQAFSKWTGGQCGTGTMSTNATCMFGLGANDTETATFMAVVCPYVFAYDGRSFVYETSVGGASVVGKKAHLHDGKSLDFAPMWARLDDAAIDYSSGTGVVRSKLIAAEDEIVYLDEASLMAVEHPVGYEVISSSSIEWQTLGEKDPGETFALKTAALRTPVHATWMGKDDVTAALSVKDEVAAQNDSKVANYYDLDFGPVGALPAQWLVIDGWKYKEARGLPADVPREHPMLEVRQADGTWLRAMELATPRGDKKSVAFNVSALAFPSGRYEMRISTGTHEDGKAMWYLDRVRLTEDPALAVHPIEVGMKSADLSFMGPPSGESSDALHPLRAVDDGKGELGSEYLTYGHFTRYGDVRELLAASDDRLVVMRRGDGVELRFVGVPKAARGNLVTVFLKTDLLFKPHRFFGEVSPELEEVEPLPYHGMGHYPPSAPFPADKAHTEWNRKYETRAYEKGDTRWGR